MMRSSILLSAALIKSAACWLAAFIERSAKPAEPFRHHGAYRRSMLADAAGEDQTLETAQRIRQRRRVAGHTG